MTEPQICTYVLRIACLGPNVTSDEVRRRIQSSIGSRHEVIHVDRMQFETGHDADAALIQDIVKIKTTNPSAVATQLMGDDWTSEHVMIFKTTGRPTIV